MKRLLALFLRFFRIGVSTIGGGYAMVPIVEHELAVASDMVTPDEIGNLLLIAQSSPGPIAVNMAVMIGYRVAGRLGSVAAGLGVILPSFVIMLLVAGFLSPYLELPPVASALGGIRGVVVALILLAAWRVGRRGKSIFINVLAPLWLLLLLLLEVDPYVLILLSIPTGILFELYRQRRKGG